MSFHNQNRSYRPVTAALACHPERSEGSLAMGKEMLRCAQHDSTDFVRTLPIARVSLVKYLIKRDAGCYCEVKRVAASDHWNFYHHIAQRLLFTG